jgi:hypothetical protein
MPGLHIMKGVGLDKQFYQAGAWRVDCGGREGVKVGVVASRGGPGEGLAPHVRHWVTRSYSGREGETSTISARAAVVLLAEIAYTSPHTN